MKMLFVDESGDHNLSLIDPNYPLFLLGGVIVDKSYYENEIIDKFNQFKKSFFGTKDIILHSSDIQRNRNGFEMLKDRGIRNEFYNQLNHLMRTLNYQVVTCAIKKDEHLARYGLAALDPYFFSLDILVERFCLELGNAPNSGVIIAESRGGVLDKQFSLAWSNLGMRGTRYMRARDIEKRILSTRLMAKKENVVGLQLADLVLPPIARQLLGKPVKEDFNIVEEKFRRDRRGNYNGFGLIVLPQEKRPIPATQ